MKKQLVFLVTLALAAALSACDYFRVDKPMLIPPNTESTTAPAESGPQITESTAAEGQLWLFPDSDRRYLNSQDLKVLTAGDLSLARNEIYARRGYVFTDPELAAFFAGKAWYVPNGQETPFSTDVFNVYEKSNVELIRIYERRISSTGFSDDNPYAKYYSSDVPYLIPTSDTVPVVEADYMGMTADQACVACNEIVARHGYTFSDGQLLEYFLRQDWYLPDTPPGNMDSITLSDIEQENMKILRDYQDTYEDTELDTAYTNVVHCDLFSVTTPAYWADHAYIKLDRDGMRFHERSAHAAEFGGHVFTVQLFGTVADYEVYPSWRLLGHLTDSAENTFYVVVLYPTDVQFDPADGFMYNKMERDVQGILATLTPAPGCTYTPA